MGDHAPNFSSKLVLHRDYIRQMYITTKSHTTYLVMLYSTNYLKHVNLSSSTIQELTLWTPQPGIPVYPSLTLSREAGIPVPRAVVYSREPGKAVWFTYLVNFENTTNSYSLSEVGVVVYV